MLKFQGVYQHGKQGNQGKLREFIFHSGNQGKLREFVFIPEISGKKSKIDIYIFFYFTKGDYKFS